jgi:tungstate transport system substrate-binding protein
VDTTGSGVGRRAFLKRFGAGSAAVAVLAACNAVQPPQGVPSEAASTSVGQPTASPASAVRTDVVRLSSVVIPFESKLYAQLLPEFERRSGYKVDVVTGQDVYGPARAGRADIVLSHYQHEGVSAFVQEGFGQWPRLVFSSPGAIIGPSTDPAKIRGLTDAVEAFRKIADAGAPFIVNDIDGLRYVGEVILRSAGLATTAGWYMDKGLRGPMAMQVAAQAGGYTMWGLVPFLRTQQQANLALEPLLTRDQILKSVMATIVVNDKKVGGVNVKGAASLQQYLMESETQAMIRNFRMAGVSEQVWWPAAQDNEKAAFQR